MPDRKRQSVPLHYSRKKDSVEINGHPDDVKRLAWVDMLLTKGLWLVFIIILLIIVPKASFVPVILKYIKDKLFLILLLALAGYSLMLSG